MKTFVQLTDSVFYIMAAFAQPKHGYAVMSEIEELTGGEVKIGPASLYTNIKKLLGEEYIVLYDESDSRRKVYTLTDKGRAVLGHDLVRRQKMIHFAQIGLQEGVSHD